MSAFTSFLSDGMSELAQTKPWGPVAGFAYGLACLSALLLLPLAVTARQKTEARGYRALCWLTWLSFGAGALVSWLIVRAAHRLILDPSSHAPGSGHAKFFSAYLEGIVQSDSAWIVSTLALVGVSFFFCIATLIRGGRHRAFASLLSLLGLATGLGLIWARYVGTLGDFCGDPDGRCEALQGLHVDAMSVSNLARIGVVVLALVGSVVLVWVERRNTRELDRVEEDVLLARGAFVLAVGLVLFFRTRPMAHDARNPIPLRQKNEEVCPIMQEKRDEETARALPHASACDVSCSGPQLVIDGERALVDGIVVADLDALEALLKQKQSLYKQLFPSKPTMPPFIVAARADTKASLVEAMVRVVRRAFGPDIAIAGVQKMQVLKTATVGDLMLLPRCCCQMLALVEEGAGEAKRLGAYATWRDVVEDAAKGKVVGVGR